MFDKPTGHDLKLDCTEAACFKPVLSRVMKSGVLLSPAYGYATLINKGSIGLLTGTPVFLCEKRGRNILIDNFYILFQMVFKKLL